MLEPDFDAIPQFLRNLPYWSAWPAIPRENGKIGKPPVGTPWKMYKKNIPTEWMTYNETQEFFIKNQNKNFSYTDKDGKHEGKISGVGILINQSLSLVAIDLDDIFDPDGNYKEWVKPIIQELLKITYCEYSPSGKGIHAFIQGKKSIKNCRKGNIEIYDYTFLTITGHKLSACPDTIASGPDAQTIIDKLITFITDSQENISTRRENQKEPTQDIKDMTDQELLNKARNANDGYYFRKLFDDGDTSKHNGDHSASDMALCLKLAYWTVKDAERMDRLFRQSALMRNDKWDRNCTQGMTYGQVTISRAIQDCKSVYDPESYKRGKNNKKSITFTEKSIKALPQKLGQDTNKISIEYTPGQMPRMRRNLEQALKNTIYQLGESLARVINVPRKDPSENETVYITRIDPLSVDAALGEADEVSTWYKVKVDKKTGDVIETPINAPIDVVKQLLSWKRWKLPLISGVVNCPVMRANGSIIDKPGYDKDTGLYAYFNPADFPKVNNKPTDIEIQKAYELIKSVLAEFPFKIDNEDIEDLPKKHISRAVAISMLLTPLIQACLDNIPLFAITSPIPGTGKSYLADLVSIVLCGARADFMNFIPDATEFEKAIFAKLLEGTQCCLIDNIDRPFNSAKLNSILSQQRMSGRVLGLSKNASVSTKCLFMATGNNLEVMGDLTRRTLLCILDANTERPAERNFKNANLHQWVLKNRGQLIHAGLTILRGHFVAGFPGAKGLTPFNTFNQWSEWIRGAVIWLGEDDPCTSQDTIREGDSERQQFFDVVSAWHEAYKDSSKKWRTAKEILEPPVATALKAALEDAVPYGRELNTRALAKWLKKHNRRIIDKKQLLGRMNTDTKIMEWQVKEVQAE